MAKVKVIPDELQRFLEAGQSQAAAAKHFGVTEAAISQRVRQSRIATSKVVALERAAQVVDQQLTPWLFKGRTICSWGCLYEGPHPPGGFRRSVVRGSAAWATAPVAAADRSRRIDRCDRYRLSHPTECRRD